MIISKYMYFMVGNVGFLEIRLHGIYMGNTCNCHVTTRTVLNEFFMMRQRRMCEENENNELVWVGVLE